MAWPRDRTRVSTLQTLQFRNRGQYTHVRLGDVHIHLIAIEIGIVRASARQVQAKGGKIQNFHAMAHDGHFVQ